MNPTPHESTADDGQWATRIRHLARASTIASATGALLVITVMAAIGSVVGSWQVYGPAPTSYQWGARVEFLGEGVATCLLGLGGLFGVYLLRRQVWERILGVDTIALDDSDPD
jgi:purine-cytosine permease-like protein